MNIQIINKLNSIPENIKFNHDGAIFTSTEYLLHDGSTLEVIYRDSEDDTCDLELELRHNKKTLTEFVTEVNQVKNNIEKYFNRKKEICINNKCKLYANHPGLCLLNNI